MGGPTQVYIFQNVPKKADDPIFSIPGDIAINWWYSNNGCRMALNGGHLSEKSDNDDNTHGFGNHFSMGTPLNSEKDNPIYKHEISNIQNCPRETCDTKNVKLQGSDHGKAFSSGPVYGNYAIFVSKDARRFPIGKNKMMLQMNESNKDYLWQNSIKCFTCNFIS